MLIVTPFAGVWIEITQLLLMYLHARVTPFAGVWIEIVLAETCHVRSARHSLRGSVD